MQEGVISLELDIKHITECAKISSLYNLVDQLDYFHLKEYEEGIANHIRGQEAFEIGEEESIIMRSLRFKHRRLIALIHFVEESRNTQAATPQAVGSHP